MGRPILEVTLVCLFLVHSAPRTCWDRHCVSVSCELSLRPTQVRMKTFPGDLSIPTRPPCVGMDLRKQCKYVSYFSLDRIVCIHTLPSLVGRDG
jgi:hypothetical protein